MTDARERLNAAVDAAMTWGVRGLPLARVEVLANDAVGAALARPDDLLAVLVEAHGWPDVQTRLDGVHRRTEGDKG